MAQTTEVISFSAPKRKARRINDLVAKNEINRSWLVAFMVEFALAELSAVDIRRAAKKDPRSKVRAKKQAKKVIH